MNVPNVPPSDPSSPGPTPHVAASSTTNSASSSDSLERMSLLSYLDAESSASLALNKALNESAIISPLDLRNAHLALAEVSAASLLTNVSNGEAAWTLLYTYQSQLQTPLTTYNNSLSTLQSAADQMNAAIDTYNQSSKDAAAKQALQDAITTYENTVGPIVDPYEELALPYNDFLEQSATALSNVNAQLKASGQTQLTLTSADNGIPDTVDPNNPIKIKVPVVQVATITLSPQPDPAASGALAQYYQQQLSAFLANLKTAKGQLQNLEAALDEAQGRNPNDPARKKLTLPSAYVYKQTTNPSSSSNETAGAQSAGPGPDAISVAMGLRNTPKLQRVLSRQVFDSISYEQRKVLPPKLVNQLIVFQLLLIKQAGSGAANALSEDPDAPRPIFNLNGALAFADPVLKAVSSGTLAASVNALINKNISPDSLTTAERQSLVSALTNALHLSLLQVVLGLIGNATGNTDLTGQVTNLALKETNLLSPATAIQLGSTSEPLSVTLLNSPLSVQSILNTLTSDTGNALLASQVLNDVLTKENPTGFNEFSNSITSALSSNGVPANQATAVGQNTGFAAANALAQSYKNLPFSPGVLPTLSLELRKEGVVSAATALPPQLSSMSPTGTLANSTLSTIYNQGKGNSVFTNAFTSTLSSAQSFQTIGQFHDTLLSQISAQNGNEADTKSAVNLANLTATLIGEQTKATNPESQVSTRSQLVESVTNSLESNVKPAGSNSGSYNSLVQRTSDTVLSILDSYNAQLTTLRERARDEANTGDIRKSQTVQTFVKNAQEASTPNLPNSTFADNVFHYVKTQTEAVQTGITPTDKASFRDASNLDVHAIKPVTDLRI